MTEHLHTMVYVLNFWNKRQGWGVYENKEGSNKIHVVISVQQCSFFVCFLWELGREGELSEKMITMCVCKYTI